MHKQTFVLPDELIQELDRYKEKNNIRTRNQALISLLTERFKSQLDEYEKRLDRIEKLLNELKREA